MTDAHLTQQIMDEYGLTGAYRTHTYHGNYPLLNLQGLMSVDQLIDTPHFRRAAAEIGTVEHLWSGEHVRVTTPEPGTFDFVTPHTELATLLRRHVTNAARDLQRQVSLHDVLEPDESAAPANILFQAPEPDFLLALGLPPTEDLRSLSRDVRLDRARAMRGQSVMDTHDLAEIEAREAMLDHGLLHFTPDPVLDDFIVTDAEVLDFAQLETLLNIETGRADGFDTP